MVQGIQHKKQIVLDCHKTLKANLMFCHKRPADNRRPYMTDVRNHFSFGMARHQLADKNIADFLFPIKGFLQNGIVVDLSIIVPVYNGEKYIGQLLDSIHAIDAVSVEALFVDDGSVAYAGFRRHPCIP